MLKTYLYRVQNQLIKNAFYVKSVKTEDSVVFLIFDDGPEEDITDFVLDELRKYGFKATFFCRGENVVKNPDLYKRIVADGHAIGNHTYSHLRAYTTSAKEYADDVRRADEILHTKLFRPPFGSLRFSHLRKLYKHYKQIYYYYQQQNYQKCI